MKKVVLFLLALFLLFPAPLQAAIDSQKTTNINRLDIDPTMSVQVSAQVGGYLFDIQGLTSPWAEVDFYSTEGNISVTTIADDQGEFSFHNVLAPLQTGDFCFLAIDTNNQANSPLCFAPPPKNTKTIITDIVLSPSLTLEKGKFKQNEIVAAGGKTFPNAQVKVFMFEENRAPWQDLLDVHAREGPQLEVMSSPNGDFSFNLPTHKSGTWRMFVGPKYKTKGFTAKSNTLEFKALSWWHYLLLAVLNWLYQALTTLFKFLFDWKTLVLLLITSLTILIYKINQQKNPALEKQENKRKQIKELKKKLNL
jgi:hypothetical protein